MTGIVFDANPTFAKKDDSKKNVIELCCTWDDSLNDRVLTFSIKNGGSDLAKIVKISINDWERLFDGILKFKSVGDESDADIEIEFKNGKGSKVGKTVTHFDKKGFIKFVEISISKKSHDVKLNSHILEQVVKHEFGHALGLGHANFKNTLMSTKIDNIITKVSQCELEAVKYANHWKLIDNSNTPSLLHNDDFKCKKK